jgi:uncharacterized protein (DUF58 family)
VAVAAPIAVALAAGTAGTRRPVLDVRLLEAPDRCQEGDVIEVAFELSAPAGADELEVGLAVPSGFEALDPVRQAVTLAPLERAVLAVRLEARRFGAHRVGRIAVRAYGPGRLLAAEEVLERGQVVRVFPRVERLAAALRPLDTNRLAGNHRSHHAGEGVEFAAVRPFVPGDAVRRVNWRVTSRRGVLHVNERHRERGRAPSTAPCAARRAWRAWSSRTATAWDWSGSAAPSRGSRPAPASGSCCGCSTPCSTSASP